MKAISLLLGAVLLLSGCGPSKEEVLRLQMLEAQRAAAAEAARAEAEAREQRVKERLQQAYQALQHQHSLSDRDIQALFAQTSRIDPLATYFVSRELQPAKYSYGDQKQRFSVVGLRRISAGDAYPAATAATPQLELALFTETELNRLHQPVTKAGGQRLTVVVGNFKQQPLLRNLSRNWHWEAGLFDDLRWDTSPEQAWALTSGRDVRIQFGLRLRPENLHQQRYIHQEHPTHSLQAEVISILVTDGRSGQVLAEFIREAR